MFKHPKVTSQIRHEFNADETSYQKVLVVSAKEMSEKEVLYFVTELYDYIKKNPSIDAVEHTLFTTQLADHIPNEIYSKI